MTHLIERQKIITWIVIIIVYFLINKVILITIANAIMYTTEKELLPVVMKFVRGENITVK